MKIRVEKHQLKILYIIFAFALVIAHCFIVTGSNDDAWFGEILDNYSLTEYLEMRYRSWSSRLFIETAFVTFTGLNPWIWKTVNILIIMLLVYECSVLWGKAQNALTAGIFMLLVFLFPLNMLSSAGWITTTICYLWPITAGIFTLLPLYKWITGEKIYKYEYIFGFAACLFGCSQEQVVAVLFVVYALYGAYCVYQKRRIPLFWWILLATSIASLIFALTCPGNENRTVLETETWFPEFSGLTLGSKILIGYLTTFSYFVSCGEYNVIFLMFSYVLALAVYRTTNKTALRCIASYPLFVTLFWGYGGRVIMRLGITTRIYWLGLIQNDKIAEFSVYSMSHIIIECIVFFTVLCAVVFSLFMVFQKTLVFLITSVILFAGLCSRIIIGLSPTVYASGSRTAALGHICFMILIFICIQKCLSVMHPKKFAVCYVPCYLFSIASVFVAAM